MGDTNLVTTAKPAVGGAVSIAALGTKLPTDTTETLDTAFTSLGYISDDGMTHSFSPDSDTIKEWGGTVVDVTQTAREDKYSFKLIEALNADVLKLVYGDANVSGTLTGETGISVSADAQPLDAHVFVVDEILKNGVKKRTVIPNGRLTELGDISEKADEDMGYEVTVTALADSAGKSHYEYYK